MKRPRLSHRSGLPEEAENLLKWSLSLAESGSYAEDLFWEKKIKKAIDYLLSTDKETAIVSVLDTLYALNSDAYDNLADLLEARTEAGIGLIQQNLGPAHTAQQTLLLVAPVMAWSRFNIPCGVLPESTVENLRVHLGAHVLARNVKFSVNSVLYSSEQLPQGFAKTALLAASLCIAAIKDEAPCFGNIETEKNTRYLSDVRYLLIGVAAEEDAPIFRWQEEDGSREEAAEQWKTQGGACLNTFLPGCSAELILPDAFFSACRQADLASRAYSVSASGAFLSSILNVSPDRLRAIIAPFYQDHELNEYRISFTLSDQDKVLHGIVWPLLEMESEDVDVIDQIKKTLRACGINNIIQIEEHFKVEFCDDCGEPLYATPDAETSHAELPEEFVEKVNKHLH